MKTELAKAYSIEHTLKLQVHSQEQEMLKLKETNQKMEEALGRHATEEELVGCTPLHMILLDMAKCMSLMGRKDDQWVCENPKLVTLEDHVRLLVLKCVEGVGLSKQAVGECQKVVFKLLDSVYDVAMTANHLARAPVLEGTWLAGVLEERKQKRRRREDPQRRGVANDHGWPAF
jgi:hypothetical protein